ncbi:molybdopterin-binding protein [Nocardioides convexus]|uniref:molybdopterin-binding protein n=1 Tax=Nocardioides convexus TaxID=2712224 RepID=UPI002418288B|nr:molybdopterin-binding protein [Nocardioides convexus]
MTARAGIVVTGTEVLTGRVVDRNGPWLAERLREPGRGRRPHRRGRRPARGPRGGAALPDSPTTTWC